MTDEWTELEKLAEQVNKPSSVGEPFLEIHPQVILQLIREARVARELEEALHELIGKHNFDDEEDEDGCTDGDRVIMGALARAAKIREGE